MLTVLLDDAAPGQRRPTAGEVADLVRGGVRARVLPPRTVGARLAAVVIAMYAALAGAAGAVSLSGYPGPPTDAQAVAAATAAVPGRPHNVPAPAVSCDIVCPFWDGNDDVVAFQAPPDRTDRTIVYMRLPPEQAPAVAVRARDRLAVGGWDVGPLRTQADGIRWFDASKDGLRLTLSAWPDTPDVGAVSAPVSVTVTKDFTVAAVVSLFVGLAGGLLVGWTTAVWLLQRYRRHPFRHRARIVIAAIPFLVVAPLTVSLTAILAVAGPLTQDVTPKILKVPLIVVPGLWWPVTAVTALSAVLALGLAARPGRADGRLTGAAQPDLGTAA